ncbi:MAG: hypothetical protein BGO25_03445 [Acidobacteriales bacterium 59-55]|nr:MAG: hypothetical protein BGO25_03445 [Acidobacteriales bacterium 59-55]
MEIQTLIALRSAQSSDVPFQPSGLESKFLRNFGGFRMPSLKICSHLYEDMGIAFDPIDPIHSAKKVPYILATEFSRMLLRFRFA